MEAKRIRVTNRKQFLLLVNRMEAHPAVAKGLKFCVESGKTEASYNAVWKNLTQELNSMGPPIRTSKEWQKVWTDFKLKVKSKLAHNRREAKATGGGPNVMKILSPIEEAVEKLLSLDKAVNHSGSTFGLSRRAASPVHDNSGVNQPGSPLLSSTRQQLVDENQSLEEFPMELDDPIEAGVENEEIENYGIQRKNTSETRKQKAHEGKDLRSDLLMEQTELLKKLVENTAECARFARKTYKLREEEFKNKREYLLRKEKDRKDELEYKMELLKYKKEKLKLLDRKERKK